jgi:hypothetical protein
VGIDHDTPAFAVASIARWWRHMGKKTYPDAQELLISWLIIRLPCHRGR